MGILNALSVLEDDGGVGQGGFSAPELIAIARQNAQRLHRALVTLLDLSALEAGTFHARLREIDLARLVQTRLGAHRSLFKDRGLAIEVGHAHTKSAGSPLLADPQKLGRAVDLCLEILIARAEPSSAVKVRVGGTQVEIGFNLAGGVELWEAAWTQALAGFQGGVASPASAFGGVMQSEQAFLRRMEEGLGSEFLLLHEVMRLHRGKFTESHDGTAVTLKLELPELSSEDGLKAVLASRAYEVSNELGSVALALMRVPEGVRLEEFRQEVQKGLFRASDAVYPLKTRGEVALVLDDCKAEDAPRLIHRLEKATGRKIQCGVAHCPADGLDPRALFDLADQRLRDPGAPERSGG